MKFPHPKVIQLMILFTILLSIFSCAKDSDLLSDAVFESSKISSIEERKAAEAEELLVENTNSDWVTKTFAFSPISDAYVQEAEGFDQSIVRLQEDYRTSYLKFDLTAIEGGNIVAAALQFTINSDDGDGTILVGKGTSNNWVEEDLTESNAPSLDITLGSINKEYNVGVTEKITLDTNEIAPEVTTIVLSHTAGNDLAFASKEHPDNIGPKMVVTYQVPPGTPDIQPMAEESNENVPAETPPENPTPPAEETPPPTEEDNGGQGSTNQYPEPDYFVTVNGKASNNGRSEASAWSIEHAFSNAVAGDVVYIKAGNYGHKELNADNSGQPGKPILFIGYTNIPGDISSQESSTFNHGDQLNSNEMPLITGNTNLDGIGLVTNENYVEVHNFQMTNFRIGIVSRGTNVLLKNIINTNNGEQNHNSSNTGRGFQIYGDNTTIENCFILNSNSEGINLKGTHNSLVKNTKVYSDNLKNMTGYYILISSGAQNNTVEGCTIYREPSGDKVNNPHQGHGYVMKDQASNNRVVNSMTFNTGVEVNFSGVHSNTYENITISGSFSSYPQQYSSCIKIKNGAHDNTFKNVTIEDTRQGVRFIDFDDGYAAADGDRDENQGGNDNTFINLNVNGAEGIVFFNSVEIGWSATSKNNHFFNCTFENIKDVPFETKQTTSGTMFTDCTFRNIPSSNLKQLNGSSGTLPIDFTNCSFVNVGFSIP